MLIDLKKAKQDLSPGRTTHQTFSLTEEILPDTNSGQTSTGDESRQTTKKNVGRKSKVNRLSAIVFGLIIFSAAGFFGYRYFTNKKQIKSIAVMPVVNESGNADVEYLSEGITETLIKRLSNIPGLSVKARSTVFYYKGKKPSPKQIGQELNVDAVLFGHLIQRGDDLKLNLELVDTATQNILWSENYDRKLNDLVSLQSEIALDVSEKLSLQLTMAEQKQVAKIYTTNSEAHQLYLRGRFHWNRRNIKDFEKAVEYFKQAIEKDSSYALAYAGLADTYALLPLYGNFRPNEYKPLAKQSALKSLELDANLAEAHTSLGYIINTYDFDWDGAEREYKKAIELNPNYATAHQWYAEHLAFKGKTEEALEEISKALNLDPFSVVINRMKGNILGFAKRYDEATIQLRKTEELYPENALVKFNLGDAYASQKMYSEAVEQYLIALKLDGQKTEEIQKFETAFKNYGWQGFWNEYLKNLITTRANRFGNGQNRIYQQRRHCLCVCRNREQGKNSRISRKGISRTRPGFIQY